MGDRARQLHQNVPVAAGQGEVAATASTGIFLAACTSSAKRDQKAATSAGKPVTCGPSTASVEGGTVWSQTGTSWSATGALTGRPSVPTRATAMPPGQTDLNAATCAPA